VVIVEYQKRRRKVALVLERGQSSSNDRVKLFDTQRLMAMALLEQQQTPWRPARGKACAGLNQVRNNWPRVTIVAIQRYSRRCASALPNCFGIYSMASVLLPKTGQVTDQNQTTQGRIAVTERQSINARDHPIERMISSWSGARQIYGSGGEAADGKILPLLGQSAGAPSRSIGIGG